MDIRLRFLTAEIAILTAIATLFNTQSPEWTKVYERRLYAEMALNLWRGGNEQKASEEVPTGADPVPARAEGITKAPVVWSEEVAVSEPQTSTEVSMQSNNEREVVEGVQPEVQNGPPIETEAAVETNSQGAPIYQINGATLDSNIANYLYTRLCEANIGWFYEFSICLCYQESSFNPLAENPNGRDKGLFQFRVEFHPELDWRNPYQQVDLYVQMMANRAMAGCDPYMMVSRHNTSDYCPEFNEVYVGQVLQHLSKLKKE